MPNVSSPLGTTQPYIPAVSQSQIGRFAGLAMIFPTVADLNTAKTASGSIWSDGQPIMVAPEFIGGSCWRVWRTGLGHARTIIIRPGLSIVLDGDSNTLLFGAGVPGSGDGADGDVSVDWAGNAYYTKAAGAWASSGSIYSSGGGSLPSPEMRFESLNIDEETVNLGLQTNNPATEQAMIFVTPTFGEYVFDEQVIAALSAYDWGTDNHSSALTLRAANSGGANRTDAGIAANGGVAQVSLQRSSWATGNGILQLSVGESGVGISGMNAPLSIGNGIETGMQITEIGAITLKTADAGVGAGATNPITIKTGNAVSGNSGSLELSTGNSSANAGDITLHTGTSNGVNGSYLDLYSTTSGGDAVLQSGRHARVYSSLDSQAYTQISGTKYLSLVGYPIFETPTTTPYTLGSNLQWTMTLTSNTNLRISARGNDGVTRVANIPLS